MSWIKKIIQYFLVFIVALFIVVILGGAYIYEHKPQILYEKSDISFEYCNTEVFNFVQDGYMTKKYRELYKNKYNILYVNCQDKYSDKRDFIIEESILMGNFIVEDNITKNKTITIPENVVQDKSTMNISFSVPYVGDEYSSTFFGFSVGKIQNRGDAIKLSEEDQSFITFSYTLDEIYENDTLDIIVTNSQGNDLLVEYTMNYYIQY